VNVRDRKLTEKRIKIYFCCVCDSYKKKGENYIKFYIAPGPTIWLSAALAHSLKFEKLLKLSDTKKFNINNE